MVYRTFYLTDVGARLNLGDDLGYLSASVMITKRGYTYDVWIDAECSVYEEGVVYTSEIPYYNTSTTLESLYGSIPESRKKDINFVATEEIYYSFNDLTRVHSYGISEVVLTDYEFDPDLNDYRFDWIINIVGSTEYHNDGFCRVCYCRY